ncbi:uncharacterized protein SPSK_09446 [Sporothrix schenckii 1099-18]|uniref:Uncharacterized protein n=1 Tax=Sporothrix schenckii 1099-18 TaxID=1397361 RepID=A0A0F2M562_SPOSC|nr:uncharacterized protein SPSK_09446 [Sporothrix schenckii 1099-18]KJR84234.1 hypothetical protein SPSK_09446 [Sporothrix schenckii 1099-18]
MRLRLLYWELVLLLIGRSPAGKYLTLSCDFPSYGNDFDTYFGSGTAVEYDPSTFPFLDESTHFAHSNQGDEQSSHSDSFPPQYFIDERNSSSDGRELVDSNFPDTAGNFENSQTYNSDHQASFLYQNHTLDDFDLSTPTASYTPGFDPVHEELPASHPSDSSASSPVSTERASSPETTNGQFVCHVCQKTFSDKSKYKYVSPLYAMPWRSFLRGCPETKLTNNIVRTYGIMAILTNAPIAGGPLAFSRTSKGTETGSTRWGNDLRAQYVAAGRRTLG